jgi:hypothetical protein
MTSALQEGPTAESTRPRMRRTSTQSVQEEPICTILVYSDQNRDGAEVLLDSAAGTVVLLDSNVGIARFLNRFSDDPVRPLEIDRSIPGHVVKTGAEARCCVVAIPVKDEAERLPACLGALAAQRDKFGRPLGLGAFGVVVLANNCSDASAKLARSLARSMPLAVRVFEESLPPAVAHAGGARRAAMDLAEAWLAERDESDGVILTTDADSRVSPDWIVNNLTAIDAGADVVLGRIVLDEEGDLLPLALHHRGLLEGVYEALLTELSALLDPLDCNPWPHHATISGATLAITVQAYRRVGGLPRIPLGEDKALIAQLSRIDARIRFCPFIQVTTSGRTYGRAPGGVADTLRLRSSNPEAFCDDALEPFRISIRRAKWRGKLRRLFQTGVVSKSLDWSAGLRISSYDARRLSTAATFGEFWAATEAASPALTKRLLIPAQLPKEISGAQCALARIKQRALPGRQDVETESFVPISALNPHGLSHASNKDFGSLVASQRIIGLPNPMHQHDISSPG